MAIIGKIQKNFWFVLVLLGLALFAFIMMDATGNSQGIGSGQTSVGTINGQEVNPQALYDLAGQMQSPNQNQNLESAWNTIVNETLVKQQAEEIGISVTSDERINMFQGSPVDPIVKRYFGGTNASDEQIKSYLAQVNEGDDNQQKLKLKSAADQIQNQKLSSKVAQLIQKSLYTPTWLAEVQSIQGTQTVDFDYVKVPFTSISPEDAQVTDADYNSYIAENKDRFTRKEEQRSIELVEFSVFPTSGDSLIIRNELNEFISDLKAQESDSSLFVRERGSYNSTYLTRDQVQASIGGEFFSAPKGTILGPYLDGKDYTVAKIIDRKVIADSVKARHIYVQPQSQSDVTAKRNLLDSLKTVLENGGDFATLATQFSQDAPTKVNGGSLGTIGAVSQYSSLPNLTNHLFHYGKQGSYEIVGTRTGLHLVQVQNRISTGKVGVRMAYLQKPVVPSDATIKASKQKAKDFVKEFTTVADFQNARTKMPEALIRTSNPVGINDIYLNFLGNDDDSRDIIKWAHASTTAVGDVSETVYSFRDKEQFFDNKFIIAGLKDIKKAGAYSLDEVKNSELYNVQRKKQGEMLKSKFAGNTDINSIAANNGASVQTATGVTLRSPVLGGNGSQAEVVSAALALENGQVSKPIVGKDGVYVVKVKNKAAATAGANVPSLKVNATRTAQQRIQYEFFNSLEKGANIEDNRHKLF